MAGPARGRAGAEGTTMQELRFVAVSEDGRYAVLAVPGRSARFTLPIDERLRAVALGQTSRLVQYEIEVESPLRPKEIQARIRAGETVEEIADAAGIAVERVRWFEGPVLAERAYAAEQAQRASVRRLGDAAPSTPGPSLGEIVTERLKMFGSDPEDAQWDAKKRGDGSWQVQLTFMSGGRLHVAEWVFDPRRRHVLPADDNAARMSLPGTEPPQPAAPLPGEATVTQLTPRLSTAAGQGLGQPANGTSGFGPAAIGNGGFGNSGASNGGPGHAGRIRHERPGPVRPTVSEPVPSVPSMSAPSVPETWVDVPRPPAAGRHSLPQSASGETMQEPAFVGADSGHNGFSGVPEPAPAKSQAPEVSATEAPDPVNEVTTPAAEVPAFVADVPAFVAEASAPVAEVPAAVAEVPAEAPVLAVEAPAAVSEVAASLAEVPAPVAEVPASVAEVAASVAEVATPVAEPAAPVHETPARQAGTPALGTGSPIAGAPSKSSAPSVTPATVAAQASRVAQAPQPPRESQPAQDSQARSETVPSGASPAASAPAAPVVAEESKPRPSTSAESAGDQAGRQGRKSARGRRSSVPSWDEIMFGNSRQRD
jgi:Protein of unknown function (DUF3071)